MDKFKLAGCTWTVEKAKMSSLGATYNDTCTIYLNSDLSGDSLSATFYHELVHAIMFTMGERNHDERFVEGFAQLLHQYEQQKV